MVSNKTYDLLKQVVTIVLPALGALYVTLAALWNLPNPEAVAGTFAALATFGGVVMKITTTKYNNSDERFDGQLVKTGVDPDTGIPNLELSITNNPNDLIAKGTVVLRSLDNS